MAVRLQSIGSLIFIYTVACYYGILMLLQNIYLILRYGIDAYFRVKPRNERPAIMNDPDLGVHSRIQLKDVSLHIVTAGYADKPLMLMVHGFPECWFSWRFQIKYFSKKYRVVACDLRGFGESDCPKGVHNYTLDKLSNDLKELIIALGYDKCILVAHDWGGIVAGGLTLKNPEMVEQLVLCNIPHFVAFSDVIQSSFGQFRKSWYMFWFQLPYMAEMAMSAFDYKFLDSIFNGQKLPNVNRKAADADEMEAFKFSAMKCGGLSSGLNYYRASMRYKPEKLGKGLEFQVPTLMIWGIMDSALSLQLVGMSSKYIPDFEVKFVPTAGHWVQQQEPDLVNKLIDSYITKRRNADSSN